MKREFKFGKYVLEISTQLRPREEIRRLIRKIEEGVWVFGALLPVFELWMRLKVPPLLSFLVIFILLLLSEIIFKKNLPNWLHFCWKCYLSMLVLLVLGWTIYGIYINILKA